MPLLTQNGVAALYHYAPLHYLPFIARERALLSKPKLRSRGFESTHFRSTSRKSDEDRGFGDYVHLALEAHPPILEAKLVAGFPHIELLVPAAAVEAHGFHLCRYNIAKTRHLRRDGSNGFAESTTNGRYYPGKQIPMAQTSEECKFLFHANVGRSVVEVLVPHGLNLPENTVVTCFHPEDQDVTSKVLSAVGVDWKIELSDRRYTPRAAYVEQVHSFLNRSLVEPAWHGDGLEFDRV